MASEAVFGGEAPDLRMSLADIARVAHVQRAVATMWRKRSKHADVGFPEPVGTHGGHPEFDAFEVAAWLRWTGLGNNPGAADDVVAYARPTGELAVHTDAGDVDVLLALAAASGEQLRELSHEDLVELADEIDPDDEVLLREVEALGGNLRPVLAYVDDLTEAAYSAERALSLVRDASLRRSGGDRRRLALHPRVQTMIARVARSLVHALDLTPRAVIDPTDGGADLLTEIASSDESGEPVTVMTARWPSDHARAARRQLLAHGLVHETCEIDDGAPRFDRPGLVVAQLPDPARPTMSTSEILDEIDRLIVAIGPDQWALVVGPASALSDRLASGDDERLRDSMLGPGRLRMILRLPAGSTLYLGQRQLAMWLIGAEHPGVKPSDARTVVGDLTGVELTDAVLEDVATDAVAALAPTHVAEAHTYRYSRSVPTNQVVAWRGDLMRFTVAEGITAPADSADMVLRIETLRERTDVGHDWSVAAQGDASDQRQTITVRRAEEIGALRVRSGHRLQDRHMTVGRSGAVVIGAEELTGRRAWGSRRIDRLLLEGAYPNARLTSPGDVIYSTGERVRARVDRDGGCVVQAPARVISLRSMERLRGALSPDVIAADLNAQPVAGRAYKSWPLRLVAEHEVEPLGRCAGAIEQRREHLRRQLADLDVLDQVLADGLANRAITLSAGTE